MRMNLRPLVSSLVIAAFAVISAPRGYADPVPPVSMSYWGDIAALNHYQGTGASQTYADAPGYTPLGSSPATVTYYPSTLKGASGSASVSGGTDPSVSANATGVGAGGSNLYYEFEVNGPTNTVIPVTITGSGGASISNPSLGAASASLDIGIADVGAGVYSEYIPYGGSYVLQDAVCVGACGSGTETSDSFSLNNAFDLQTNTIYAVEMDTEYSIGPGAVTASAFVDPTITLDSTDPAYSLVFSPGLLPTSATPEPSSLLLVATALLGGAGVIRRRVSAR